MALIKCPDCGKLFSEYAERCPDCGCPTKDAKAANIANDSPFSQPTEGGESNEQAQSLIDEKGVEGETVSQENVQPSTENDESNIEVQKTIRKWLWCVGIMAVLIVGFIIVYNSFDPQKDDDRTSKEVIAQRESPEEIESNAFTELRTYFYKNVWDVEMDDGYGNPSTVEASESVTIKFSPNNSVRIEYEVQEFQEWEGTYSLEGQTITMNVQQVYVPERKEVITAKLDGNELALDNNNVCGVVKLKRSGVSEQRMELIRNHEWGDNMLHHHLVGTMSDETGKHPIELDFDYSNVESGTIENAIYKNVELGGRIKMNGEVSRGGLFIFSGKDGNQNFTIRIDPSDLEGESFIGGKNLTVSLLPQCNHSLAQ